jgi:glycosyltransferase involved in cell wall biosynthesis
MLSSQSEDWEKATDNIHYRKNLLSRLANIERIPPYIADFLIRLNNKPWWAALRLLSANKPYDIVVTGDYRVGRAYAILQMLFRHRRKPHLFLDFMLDDPQPSVLWKIKRFYQKKVFGLICRIVVFSQNEVETYARDLDIPKEKFVFLPYHTNISEPHFVGSKSDYIFSAGYSGRDYKTLIEAVRGTDLKVKIVARPENINGLNAPSNVEIICDVPYFDYLELISDSRFVVIPLKSHIRSLGMLVMLEGMSLGKAVIITHAVSNVEYIREGENGFFVDFSDPDRLREKMFHLWNNPDLCDRVGKQAVEDVKSNWTYKQYVNSVFEIIRQMVRDKSL